MVDNDKRQKEVEERRYGFNYANFLDRSPLASFPMSENARINIEGRNNVAYAITEEVSEFKASYQRSIQENSAKIAYFSAELARQQAACDAQKRAIEERRKSILQEANLPFDFDELITVKSAFQGYFNALTAGDPNSIQQKKSIVDALLPVLTEQTRNFIVASLKA
jgi:hypothetical protein